MSMKIGVTQSVEERIKATPLEMVEKAPLVFCWETEYSCAMKSHFRKFGNQMSGSGNHLCNYASLLA